MKQNSKKRKEEVKTEQKGLSYREVKALMQQRNEFTTELDHLPKQLHKWTDRGANMTCENAGHEYHQAWKPLKQSKVNSM